MIKQETTEMDGGKKNHRKASTKNRYHGQRSLAEMSRCFFFHSFPSSLRTCFDFFVAKVQFRKRGERFLNLQKKKNWNSAAKRMNERISSSLASIKSTVKLVPPKRLYIWGAVLVRGYFRGCGAGLKERAGRGTFLLAGEPRDLGRIAPS